MTQVIFVIQRIIRIHHTHQGHIVKIQPLGHHLGAHQNIIFVSRKGVKQLLVAEFTCGGVCVHTQNSCRGKQRLQFILDPLGAEPTVPHRVAAAFRARIVQRLGIAAIVAHQPVGITVIRQRNRAVGAGDHMTAVVAGNECVVSPPVHQKNGLLARVQIGLYLLLQGAA